jgi:selenocysteine lyase/cysteine desulfurase
MERRAFVGRLAAGLGTAAWLPGLAATAAAAQPGRSLADELKDAQGSKQLWARVKKEFMLKPGLVYLNTGSVGATPRPVVEAVSLYMKQLEGDPESVKLGPEGLGGDPTNNEFGPMGHSMEQVRTKAADLFGARVEEMVVTDNTTSGMNAVALGIKLRPGDEVLTTNHEHPGGLVCWEYLAKHHGVKIVQIKMPAPIRDKAHFLDLVKKHLTRRTKVCSLMHVDTITGMQLPLADVARITRPRGILLVCDGAHGPGMLKIDVKALGVDTYASSSHKWLLAPKGSGLLYIRKEVQDRVQPLLLYSGYNVYTASSGTRDLPHVLGHGDAIDFHNAIGSERVEARCRELNAHLRKRFAEIPALRLLTPSQHELSSGIASYSLTKGKNSELYKRLHDEDIVVKLVPKADLNAIRLSTHIYVTEEEIDRTADAIKKLLA